MTMVRRKPKDGDGGGMASYRPVPPDNDDGPSSDVATTTTAASASGGGGGGGAATYRPAPPDSDGGPSPDVATTASTAVAAAVGVYQHQQRATVAPEMDTPPAYYGEEDDSDLTVRLALAALLVLLTSMFVILAFLVFRARLRRRREQIVQIRIRAALIQQELLRGRHHDNDEPPLDEERLKRRYETIETWLISKRVQKHDDVCDRVLRKCNVDVHSVSAIRCHEQKAGFEEAGSGHGSDLTIEEGLHIGDSDTVEAGCCSSSSSTAASFEKNECPICFEPFKAGEIVSWSPGTCRHVFHHECIKQWLVHKSDCPCCRQAFLSLDRYRGDCAERGDLGKDKVESLLRELRADHLRRSALSYVCVKDGLVEIPANRQSAYSATELRDIEAKTGCGIVSKDEKAELRGGSKRGRNSSSDNDKGTDSVDDFGEEEEEAAATVLSPSRRSEPETGGPLA